MKTSDKIILFSTLTALGIFGGVQFLQFARFRAGDILTVKDLDREDFVSTTLPRPASLLLEGPMRAFVLPADSFHFSIDINEVAAFHYHQAGDSLVIEGDKRLKKSPHQGWFDYMGFPTIHIYTPRLKNIRVNNGFVVLQNDEGRAGISVALDLDSSQIWVGAYNADRDSVVQTEPYDSITIHAVNSAVILNRQAQVKALDLWLDDRSDIVDRWSRLDTAHIRGEKNTYIQIRGRSLSKIRWEIPDHSTP
jgi:hypothetical protein